MGLRRYKNRRRADARQQVIAVKSALRAFGKALLWTSLACGALVALSVGGYRAYQWAHSSPYFLLKAVDFRGLHHAREGDLYRLAGLSVGQNLFELEPSAIERAMNAHPWVREVRVARRLPASLSVAVKEHVPAAVVALGDLYLADDEGRPFKKVQSGDPTDLPLVTGLQREQFVEGPEQSRVRLRAALDVAIAYAQSDAGKSAPLSEIRLGRTGMALVTAEGQEVRLSEGDPADALLRLEKVKAELEKRGLMAQVIHLENRSRPGWVAVKLSNLSAERKGARVR